MWNEERSLELIGVYTNKPVLWNPKNPAYYRKPLKNDAWREIADSMQMDAEECKNKMISLLASYRREKAKIRKHEGTGKGSGEIYQSTWFAYQALAFLGGRDNPRKRLDTMITNDNSNIEEATASAHNSEETELITPPSQPKRWQGEKKRKIEMLSEAIGILRSASLQPQSARSDSLDDESIYFSKFICSKMTKYSEHTKNAVQRAITDIIFKADQGHYDYNTNHNRHHQYPYYGGYNTVQTEAQPTTTAATPSPSYTLTSEPSPTDSQQSINTDELI